MTAIYDKHPLSNPLYGNPDNIINLNSTTLQEF